MKPIFIGLCWATALVLVALGNQHSLIADYIATTLFAILPLFAVIAMTRGRSCAPSGA